MSIAGITPQLQKIRDNGLLFNHYFTDPSEALEIAMQYLPDNPVIINAGEYNGHETCNVVKLAGHEVVQVADLNAWAKEYDIPKMDMLLVHAQGAEFNALKAAPGLLSGVLLS